MGRHSASSSSDRLSGRISWSLADQVMASASNFALMVLVARVVSPVEFGVFSIGIAGIILAIWVGRGLGAEPLVVRYTGATDEQWSLAVRASAATTLALGAAVASVVLGVGLLCDGVTRSLLVVTAAVLPGVLLQDHIRYAFFSRGQPRQAFINDLFWAVLQLGSMSIVLGNGIRSIPLLLLLWGLSGTVAAGVGLGQLRRRPDLRLVRWWLREHRELWRSYVAENGLMQGTNFAVLALVGLLAGTAAAGGIRAAVLVFSPLTVLGVAAMSSGVAELSRLGAADPQRLRRYPLILGCGLGLFTACWGAGALLLPDPVGQALFGGTWTIAQPLLYLTTFDAIASMFIVGPFIGLRVLAIGGRGLQVRVAFSALRLAVAGAGAHLGGAQGAATGFAIVAPLQMAGWWWQFRRSLANRMASPLQPVALPSSVTPLPMAAGTREDRTR